MRKNLLKLMFCLLNVYTYGQIEVFVSTGQAGNSAIKKFDENGAFLGNFITFNSTPCPINWTQDIVLNPYDCTYLVSSFNTNQILKFDVNTGECLGVFATVTGTPTRMKIGEDNILYVLQWANNALVRRYSLDGTFLGNFTNVGVTNSIGIDWDEAGNLYVSSYNGNFVRKFDQNGNNLGLFINSNLQGPTNIWFNSVGEMFTLNWDGNRIKKFSSAGSFLGNVGPVIVNPEGVAFLPNGDFLVGNGAANGKISKFSSTGTFLGDFAIGNNMSYPNGIYIRDQSLTNVVRNKTDNKEGSLRSVIACVQSGDTITFDQTLADTVNVDSSLTINKNLFVFGPSVINVNGTSKIKIGNQSTTLFNMINFVDTKFNSNIPTIETIKNIILQNCQITGVGFVPFIHLRQFASLESYGINEIKSQ